MIQMSRPFAKFFRPVCGLLVLVLVACGEPKPDLAAELQEVEASLAAQDYELAAIRLEALREHYPDDPQLQAALGRSYQGQGRFAEAGEIYNQLVTLYPTEARYHLGAARAAAVEEPTQAARDYRTYLSAEPRDRQVWVELGDTLLLAGDRSGALDAYLQANRLEPTGNVQVVIADTYLASGNLAQAQTWYAQAANTSGGSRERGLLGLLETAVKARRFADAEALLAQIDQEFPDAVDRSRLAELRPQLAQWREAQRAAEEAAAALRPSPTPVAPTPAETPAPQRVVVLNRPAEVIPAQERPEPPPEPAPPPPAPDDEPTELAAAATVPAVVALDKEGMVREVEAQMAAQAAAAPAEAPAPSEQPASLFPERSFAPAQVVPQAPPPPDATYTDLLQAARSAREAGDLAGAIATYRRALVVDGRDAEVWRELSETQLRHGQSDWAQASAKEAMRRAPDDPRYALHLLRVGQQTMLPEELLREMRLANQRFPRSLDITLALARGYVTLRGDTRSARVLLESTLATLPPNDPSRALLAAELERL